MSRVLFWLALLILVLLAVRSKLKSMRAGQGQGQGKGQGQGRPGPENAGPPARVEAMSCCAHCAIHFPASEAIRANGREYCSPAHAQLTAPAA